VRCTALVADELTVEVVFALPDQQVLVSVTLAKGATVSDAINRSGLRQRFVDEQLDALPTGIWGHPVERNQPVSDGDRVEIYRPLEMDPREARRLRA
jgi:putative ubiquitin-RnfH superfamily antitoxin RatB of RatAB toxin-antitoxin module